MPTRHLSSIILTMNSAAYLTTLHRLLNEYFSLEEIHTLCFNLHIDYESVPGEEKQSRIRELLLGLGRRSRLIDLIPLLQQERPLVDWPSVPDDFQMPEALAMGETAVSPQTYHYYGDVVQGDVIHGDKVAGHKIQTQTYVEKQIIVHGPEITDLEHMLPETGDSPYQGLHYFEEKDADWFFGRERVTAVLINRLHETNFLAVVGASGSGKSSVVRAGVIPAMKGNKPLADGSVPPLGDWQVKVMTPTARPLDRLVVTLFPEDKARQAEVHRRLSYKPNALRDAINDMGTGERPLLLVVDQFEELFSQCKDEQQREAFIANLVAAAHPDCKIILTLRADFYSPCLRYESLRGVLKEGQEPLGPMNREELRGAILGPAVMNGWKVQDGLAEEILDDVGQEPGALPLLSHALRETWERRRGRVMTFSGYRAAGGVKGAIAQTAEAVYQSLAPDEKALAQQIFLRLTELGEGTQDTRRRLGQAELRDDPLTAQLTQKLADTRLITISESVLEVAHEALIREWPRLREWLDTDREGLILHRRLTNAAQDWHINKKDTSLLFRGVRLTELKLWSQHNSHKMSEQELEFLEISAIEQDHQSEEEEKKRQIIEALQIEQVVKRRIQGNMLAQDAQEKLAKDPERSLLLSIASLGIKIQSHARLSLADALQSPYRTTLYGHKWWVNSAVFSPDGQTILTASKDGTVRLWNLQGNTLSVFHGHEDTVNSAVFSPDGQTILTASKDTTIRLWDMQGNELNLVQGHEDTVNSAVFSPDGQTFLTAGKDKTVRLWDTQGKTLAIFHGHEDEVNSAVFSPDGQTVLTASGDGTTRLWDKQGNVLTTLSTHSQIDGWHRAVFSPDGQMILINNRYNDAYLLNREGQELAILKGHKSIIWSATFSPDAKMILTASGDSTARLWDIQGKKLNIFRGHDHTVHSAMFSPDGQTIVTASWDGTARLWDTQDSTIALKGHEDSVNVAVFSPNGDIIVTASNDSTARLWDKQGNELITLGGHKSSVYSAVFSPDGQAILTASGDNTARLWDKQGNVLTTVNTYNQKTWWNNWAVFSPDGQTILTASEGNTARLWDKHGNELIVLDEHADRVTTATFSPDGQMLLTASKDGTVRLWNRCGKVLAVLGKQAGRGSGAEINSVVFSPDGYEILIASQGGMAQLWDLQGNLLSVFQHDDVYQEDNFAGQPGAVKSAVFSPDGQTILTASIDGKAILWDRKGKKLSIIKCKDNRYPLEDLPVVSPMIPILSASGGHEDGKVQLAAFSPDGQTILTVSCDGVNDDYDLGCTSSSLIKLWDLQGNKQAILHGNWGAITSAMFSPDGQAILVANREGCVWLCPSYTVDHMVQEAYKRIQRGFTKSECQKYFRDDPDSCPHTKEELFAPLARYLTNP